MAKLLNKKKLTRSENINSNSLLIIKISYCFNNPI